MPLAEYFTPVECGGDGDCAYCSIAAGMAHSTPGQTPKPEHLRPRGKLQAHLRCLAAKELRDHPECYPIGKPLAQYAAATATAGTWAESPSLIALAQAAKLELRIWAWEHSLSRWQLYVVKGPRPAQGKRAQQTTTIWLKLADKHYQWLKPTDKGEPPSSTLDQAVFRSVGGSTDPLAGAGPQSQASSVSARRLLGLRTPSAVSLRSSASSPSTRRVLGLGSAASSAPPALAPSAPRSAGAPTLLGLRDSATASAAPARSTAARPLARLAAGAASAASVGSGGRLAELQAMEPHVPGGLWDCPCGWKSSGGGATERKRAIRHWRDCLGCQPPRRTTDTCRSIGAYSSGSAATAEKAKESFGEWARTMSARGARAAEATCTPDLDTPFCGTTRNGGGCRLYACTRCGEQRSLTDFKRRPCKSRPLAKQGGLTTLEWLAFSQGEHYATRQAKAQRASHHTWVRTEAGRLCQNRNNVAAYWRAPDKHRARKQAERAANTAVKKRPAQAAHGLRKRPAAAMARS